MALNIPALVESLKDCPCGRKHEINISRVEIREGLLPWAMNRSISSGSWKPPTGAHSAGIPRSLNAAANWRQYGSCSEKL